MLLDQISLDEAIGLRRDFLSFAVRDFSSVVCFPGKNLKSSQVIRSFHNGLNHIKSTWDFFFILFHDGLDVTRTPGPVGPVLKSEKSERPLVQKEWGVDCRDLKLIDHTMIAREYFLING